MALRRRATADGNGPDPAIVRRILVRDHVGSDPLHVAIVNVLASGNVPTVIVIGIVREMARDVLGHATKLRRRRRKPRRITPNATITMTVTGHRIVIANATAIVNAARSIVRGIKLERDSTQPTYLAFRGIICVAFKHDRNAFELYFFLLFLHVAKLENFYCGITFLEKCFNPLQTLIHTHLILTSFCVSPARSKHSHQ